MRFTNIVELHFDTKKKIDELIVIADTLLGGHRAASDMIDPAIDHRKKYVDQLDELNQTISTIVDTHPAMSVEKVCQNVANEIYSIATLNKRTFDPTRVPE